MTDVQTLRRKAGTAVLRGFRALPLPLKYRLVRSGTPNYTVGAVCVIEHEGDVLVLGQPHRDGWSLPGGLLARGETPAEAVSREVAEETGLRVDPGDAVATAVRPDSQSVDVIFRVVVDQRPEVHVSHEARRHRWVSLSALQDADEATRQIITTLGSSGREAATGTVLSGSPDSSDQDVPDPAGG